MRIILAACAAVLCAGCATSSQDDGLGGLFGEGLSGPKLEEAMAKANSYPLGSEQNPVRSSMPVGERAYLERLRCSDRNAPTFERRGSTGVGPYGNILDVYELHCLSGTPASADVYMDMYHEHVETRAVPGFTIKPE